MRREPKTERGSERTRHKAGVCEWRQVMKPNAVFVGSRRVVPYGKGDRRLAYSAGTNDRHEASALQSQAKHADSLGPSDQPRQTDGKIVFAALRFDIRSRRSGAQGRSHKAIA